MPNLAKPCGLPDAGQSAYLARMAKSSEDTAAPKLFDRALLRARMERARRAGSATFLLDRIREDFEERLQAVMRNFADVADIWTPGELLRPPIADRFQSIRHFDFGSSEILPL